VPRSSGDDLDTVSAALGCWGFDQRLVGADFFAGQGLSFREVGLQGRKDFNGEGFDLHVFAVGAGLFKVADALFVTVDHFSEEMFIEIRARGLFQFLEGLSVLGVDDLRELDALRDGQCLQLGVGTGVIGDELLSEGFDVGVACFLDSEFSELHDGQASGGFVLHELHIGTVEGVFVRSAGDGGHGKNAAEGEGGFGELMDGLFDHDLCFLWFFVYLGDTVTGLTLGSLDS
jgi:hypothetical protein